MKVVRRIDFKFPFPTLKQLAILTICRHWVDHKLVPYGKFEDPFYKVDSFVDTFGYLVESLPIPPVLKPDVWHIFYGVFYEIRECCKKYFPSGTNTEFCKGVGACIDGFGRFDDARFMRCYIKKRVSVPDMTSLCKLFALAYNVYLLPEIDAILRKLVTVVDGKGRGSEVLLEGPFHELRDRGIPFHVMVYNFLSGIDPTLPGRVRQVARNFVGASIEVSRDHISIVFDVRNGEWIWHNIDFLKEHVNLQPFTLTRITALPDSALPQQLTNEEFIKSFSFQRQLIFFGRVYPMDQQRNQGLLSYIREREFARYHLFLRLLVWPYTLFFFPMLELLGPYMTEFDYCHLFTHIVNRMIIKRKRQYTTIYVSFLLELWSSMPVELKLNCARSCCGREQSSDVFRHLFARALKELQSVRKSVYNGIMTEMRALMIDS